MARYEVRAGIALLTLDNPPVNGLGMELRFAIRDALERAAADPAVAALVIAGNERFFSGGADIRQFNTPKYWARPRTIDLGDLIEAMPKVVVAAIGGVAMGGGLELALACHYRIALPDARLALSEVKLGLLPGGGGTVRLPRLAGVESAVRMMMTGDPVSGTEALALGVVDVVETSRLVDAALAFARDLAARGAPLRRARDIAIDIPAGLAAIERTRVNLIGRPAGPAALTILGVIEAGLRESGDTLRATIDEGTRALMDGPESKALRHVFFAERDAARLDASDATPPEADAKTCTVLLADVPTVLEIEAVPASAALVAIRAARLRQLVPVVVGTPGCADALLTAASSAATELMAKGIERREIACALIAWGFAPAFVDCLPGRTGVPLALAPPCSASRDSPTSAAAPHHTPAPIVDAIVTAMNVAGHALVASGRARRAADIDVLAVRGLGFPGHRGGPMYMAEQHKRRET